MSESLEGLRKKIDSIDDSIAKLYLERMDVAREIGDVKKQNQTEIDAPKRENDILYRVLKQANSEKQKAYLKQLYEYVFSMSKMHQREGLEEHSKQIDNFRNALKNKKSSFPISASVACQGVEGAYSEIAAKKLFEVSNITYFKTFESVFDAVDKGLCEYGVVPLENSTAGSVLPVYDALTSHKLFIVRSVKVKVGHCLASKSLTSKITSVYSHSQALSQCSSFLKKSGIMSFETDNTALAARMVRESEDEGCAAICSEECASLYSLHIRERDIQDSGKNSTTFICISKNLEIYEGSDKVSILTSLEHKPGSLSSLLSRFYIEHLNLTKLVTRPLNEDDGYMFYFDFEGDSEKETTLNLLSNLENASSSFAFLGRYKEV